MVVTPPLARGADGTTNADVTAKTRDMTKSTQLKFLLLASHRAIVSCLLLPLVLLVLLILLQGVVMGSCLL